MQWFRKAIPRPRQSSSVADPPFIVLGVVLFSNLVECDCSLVLVVFRRLTCRQPVQGLLQMSTRGTLRHRSGIESNGCNDCLISCCCGCCALIQEDKEIRFQQERMPMVQKGYVAPNGGQQMMYTQQPGQVV